MHFSFRENINDVEAQQVMSEVYSGIKTIESQRMSKRRSQNGTSSKTAANLNKTRPKN